MLLAVVPPRRPGETGIHEIAARVVETARRDRGQGATRRAESAEDAHVVDDHGDEEFERSRSVGTTAPAAHRRDLGNGWPQRGCFHVVLPFICSDLRARAGTSSARPLVRGRSLPCVSGRRPAPSRRVIDLVVLRDERRDQRVNGGDLHPTHLPSSRPAGIDRREKE